MMNHFQVDAALKTAVILVDTREQDTPKLKKRLEAMDMPHAREKLAFGDYSIKCQLPSGAEFTLKNSVTVERKMNFTELANCYCSERPRFTREFERAREAEAKVYLLVEDATWEKAYKGDYRSKMRPASFIASMTAWLARYHCQIIFCKPDTSGHLIRDILLRELKERLVNLEADSGANQAICECEASG